MKKINKTNYKEIPLLTSLSEEEFLLIEDNLNILNFSKGDTIFRYRDPASRMYIILEGEIKISKIMSDGKEQILYIYGPGQFVGAHNILSRENYEYSAYALRPSRVLTVSSHDIHKVLKHNNDFLLEVLSQSFDRIRKAETLIDRLSVISTDVKVAKLLKTLISLYGKEKQDGVLIQYNITQEELGSLTGLSRETMSRKLNQFEDMGILKILSRGKIIIYKPYELDNILLNS